MKHKRDMVHYVRVWKGQLLYSDMSDMSVIAIITDGDCTIKADSQTIRLETGEEILVRKDTTAYFGDNKATLLVIRKK
jgi:mannose-6-phosphate isomerase class I